MSDDEVLAGWRRPAPIGTSGAGDEPLVALLELYHLNGCCPLPASVAQVCLLVGVNDFHGHVETKRALRAHFTRTRAGWVWREQARPARQEVSHA